MNDLVNLMTAKAIQSNVDKRMATFIGIDGDNVTLDMERIGKRVFPLRLVQKGFVFHMDFDSLIVGVLRKEQLDPLRPTSDAECNELAIGVFKLLSNRFEDITHVDCWKSVRKFMSPATM